MKQSLTEYTNLKLDEKVKELRKIANIMAINIVDDYVLQTGIVMDSKEFNAQADVETDELIALSVSDRHQFDILFSDFFHSIKDAHISQLPQDLAVMLEQLDQVKKGGGIMKGAGAAVRSRLRDTLMPLKQLGIKVDSPMKDRGFFRQMMSPNFVFDPNKDRLSKTQGSAQTFDIKAFKKDDDYRRAMLELAKSIEKNSAASTKEERLLAAEVKKQNDRLFRNKEYAASPESRMSVAERGLYESIQGVLGFTGGLLKSLSRPRKGVQEQAAEVVATNVTPKVEQPAARKEQKKPAVDMPLFSKPLGSRIETVGMDELFDDGHSPSYIMSNDDAGTEEKDEEEDEFREATIEADDKKIELLKKIDDDVHKMSLKGDDSGGILGGLLSGLGALLTSKMGDLIKGFALRFLPMLATFLGPLLLPLAGIAAAVGAFVWLKNETSRNIEDLSPEERGKFEAAKQEHQAEEYASSQKKYWMDPAHATQLESLHKQGFLVPGIDNVETITRANGSMLEKKQEVAEAISAEKESTQMAATMSNVIAPTSNVVAPAPAPQRPKDSPRNPDNSLSLYLNSRVAKFA